MLYTHAHKQNTAKGMVNYDRKCSNLWSQTLACFKVINAIKIFYFLFPKWERERERRGREERERERVKRYPEAIT